MSSPDVRQAIEDLLEAKRAGGELDYGPVVPALSRFIESEMMRLAGELPDRTVGLPAVEKLDVLFRAVLREVWGQTPGPDPET